MLKPNLRKTVILLTFVLDPFPATPAGAAETLWDVLLRTKTSVSDRQTSNLPIARRKSLGPVPGFSIPISNTEENDQIFSKSKKGGGVFNSIGDWFTRMESLTGTKIKASGHNTLSFRAENVSGNSSAYRDEQYYGRGSNGIYNDADLNIDATFLNFFHYQTRINNSLFQSPTENRVKLDYNTPKVRFEWGDINAGFSGNSLIDFNRYLSGFKITNNWSRQVKTSFLYSTTKAETRTITIPGNNSSGPYYVYAGQIVEGSDRVRVDNRELSRGQDYTLDLYTGELRFTSGNVVLNSQSIAVTFESLGYNQSQGNILGFRSEIVPKGTMRFGFTYVSQTSKVASGLQTRTQQFQGSNNTFYILDAAIDLTKPLIVTIDSDPQVRGVGYTVDNTRLNQIVLTTDITGHLLTVKYVPLDSNPTPGNRSVLGLDGSVPIGKLGNISLESAFSGLTIAGANTGGRALQLRADLTPMRSLHTNIILRDVNPTFSSIQTPGFNRNEKSVELTGDYQPFKNLRMNFDWQKARRPSYSSSGTNLTNVNLNGNDSYNQYSLGANYSFGKNASLSVSRNSLGTKYILGGQSKNLNDSVAINYGFKSVTFDAGVSHNVSNSDSVYNSIASSILTSSQISANSATLSKHFGVTWRASRWLDLNGTISDNAISNNSAGSTSKLNARDSQMTARFTPNSKIRFTYGYQLSDTGNTAGSTAQNATTNSTTTTTNSGTGSILPVTARSVIFNQITRDLSAGGGIGTGSVFGAGLGTTIGGGSNANLGTSGNYGGIYGGSTNTGYGASSYGGKSTSNRFSFDYQPRAGLQIGLQADIASSVGDYQYNSNRRNLGFNIGWQPSDRFQLNTNYSIQKVAYTGSLGGTKSNTLFFMMQGKPFGGKLGTQLSWQSMRTSSNVNFSSTAIATDTGTNLSSLSARLDYPISSRHTLFTELLSSNSSGYLASTDSNFRFGMDYTLTRAFHISLGWQFLNRANHDSTNAKYDYKVSSLLAELGLNF